MKSGVETWAESFQHVLVVVLDIVSVNVALDAVAVEVVAVDVVAVLVKVDLV